MPEVGCNSQRKLVAESRVHTAEHVAAFSVQRSAFSVQLSASTDIDRSVQLSAFSVQLSAFSVQLSVVVSSS